MDPYNEAVYHIRRHLKIHKLKHEAKMVVVVVIIIIIIGCTLWLWRVKN